MQKDFDVGGGFNCVGACAARFIGARRFLAPGSAFTSLDTPRSERRIEGNVREGDNGGRY